MIDNIATIYQSSNEADVSNYDNHTALTNEKNKYDRNEPTKTPQLQTPDLR